MNYEVLQISEFSEISLMYFCNEISHLQFFQKINMNLFIILYAIVGFFSETSTPFEFINLLDLFYKMFWH